MYYSSSTGGFYDAEIHGENIPSDAIEITNDAHVELLNAQSSGKKIVADESGHPIAIDPPPNPPLTRDEIEALRLRSYADPITGSDRYFTEAASMDAAGEAGSDELRELGLARRAEIQSEYTWPT